MSSANKPVPVTGLDVGAEAVLHMNHAREKHPWPGKGMELSEYRDSFVRQTLANVRTELDVEHVCFGYQMPVTAFRCEVLEFLDAVIRGNRNDAFHELMDALAVGLRILNSDAGNVWNRPEIRFPNREPRPFFPEDDE